MFASADNARLTHAREVHGSPLAGIGGAAGLAIFMTFGTNPQKETLKLNATVVEPDEVREVLERIVRRPEFADAPRLSAFLQFVVNETLEGRASRVKAYTIATSVFGRDASFDPQTNPVVRVEAMRLRQALNHYFAVAGSNEPIEIRMDRGTYVPEFLRRPEAQVQNNVAEAAASPAANANVIGAPWKTVAAGLVAVLLASGVYFALPSAGSKVASPPPSRVDFAASAPTIHASVSAVEDAKLKILAGRLVGQIETALSRFDYPLVVQQPARPASWCCRSRISVARPATSGSPVRFPIR